MATFPGPFVFGGPSTATTKQTASAASVQQPRDAINAACQGTGFSCKYVSWDDANRGVWGSNITDTRLYERSGTLLYTCRPDNWNEKLGCVSADDIAVVVGNHERPSPFGGTTQLKPITLTDFLGNAGTYAAYTGIDKGTNLYDFSRDNKVSIRFQTTFLPINNGATLSTSPHTGPRLSTEFCTEAYNYNTESDEDPRNAVVLCTTQGIAFQQDGARAKRLYHHSVDSNGTVHQHWLEAEHRRHAKANAVAHGKATASVIGIKQMGTRFNALMTVQIPLQQQPAHFGANPPFGSGGVCNPFGGGGSAPFGQSPFGVSHAPAPAMFSAPVPAFAPAPVAPSNGPFGSFIAAAAAAAPLGVSRGSKLLCDFIGAKKKEPKRDSSQHITVTIVLYNTVVGGVPSVQDVKAAIDDMEKLYSACSWRGNLADNQAAFMTSKLASESPAGIAGKIATRPGTNTCSIQNSAVCPTSNPVSVFKQSTAESVNDLINKSIPKLSKASQLVASLESGASSNEAEALLTECFHSFRLANDKYSDTEGAPSAVALYNMACVLSLALELQMIVSRSQSLQAMVDSFGSVAVSTLQSCFVSPGLPPRPLSSTATLRDTINKRAIACDRCLKAAVAVGWTDFNHLRADRDLRAYLTSMDTTWFPSS